MTKDADTAADGVSVTDSSRCPCSSGEVFGHCCAPLLGGAPAPTAERLMRSRYTAFCLADDEYLLRTWHPTTRPRAVESDPDLRWRRLIVFDRSAGGPFDREGVVEFEAFWCQGAERGSLHERSRFVREERQWFYVDGDVS